MLLLLLGTNQSTLDSTWSRCRTWFGRCSQGFARSTGDVRQPGRLVSGGYPGRRLVCSRASSMYWFKVSFLWGVVGFWSWCHLHANSNMFHTPAIWGLFACNDHVHWGCVGRDSSNQPVAASVRLQSRLVWDVPKALQGRQGMCGSLAGWFQVAIQAVDWFVPEHHLCIGLWWWEQTNLRPG